MPGATGGRVVDQVILPRRVVPQPTPNIFPAGDCGACVFGGLVAISPAEVYRRFHDDKRSSLSWFEMRSALHQADGELLDRINVDPPMLWPPCHESQLTFGMPALNQALGWFSFARMAIDAGYYGLAEVDYAKTGRAPDHWVLLCGHREVWPARNEGGPIHPQLLVSCSARSSPDEEWVNVHDFLEKRGGFHAFWARPAK